MKTSLRGRTNAAPAPSFPPVLGRVLRKCACGGTPGPRGECEACRKKRLQRAGNSSATESRNDAGVPPIVHEVLRSPGQPLHAKTRAFMEPRFGHDFSRVRVHTNSKAAESARAVNAQAYAVGHNLVFAGGKYSPETSRGRELLAHELTHNIQQGTAENGIGLKLEPATRGDRAEREANGAAALVAQGHAVGAIGAQETQIARQESEEKPAVGEAGAAAATGADATIAPTAEEAKTEAAPCALTTYTGSNFVGDTVTADVEFTDSLDAINQHAADNKVDLHITSSFRTSTDVPGAVVTPAKMSNHMAGHAIDMNVKYGDKKDKLCNSTCLGGTLPAGVAEFIKAIQDDAGLRWGGDFKTKDPVHIDDNLNADTEAWKKRKEATQAARKSGCG